MRFVATETSGDEFTTRHAFLIHALVSLPILPREVGKPRIGSDYRTGGSVTGEFTWGT